MERLKPVAEELHRNGAVCVLATGIGDYVRCTPLEYSFHDGQFWILFTNQHLGLDLSAPSEA